MSTLEDLRQRDVARTPSCRQGATQDGSRKRVDVRVRRAERIMPKKPRLEPKAM